MTRAALQPARVAAPLAIGLGLVALAARVPSNQAVLITAAVGAVGLLTPLPDRPGPEPVARTGTEPDAPPRRSALLAWLAACALGVGALLIAGRLPGILGMVARPARLVAPRAAPLAVAASLVAAVSEELFFRRLLYGWLLPWGTAWAIGGSALAFAAIHVPVYGWAVLPIDAAAGALLGWQRWVTGGWSASALTHSMANLIAEGVLP